jgi:hypothetical protein
MDEFRRALRTDATDLTPGPDEDIDTAMERRVSNVRHTGAPRPDRLTSEASHVSSFIFRDQLRVAVNPAGLRRSA